MKITGDAHFCFTPRNICISSVVFLSTLTHHLIPVRVSDDFQVFPMQATFLHNVHHLPAPNLIKRVPLIYETRVYIALDVPESLEQHLD